MQFTLGQRLKSARESRCLSLLDVHHCTRIPVARVQQLEDDNYAAFGSMAYAKSFLKTYSQFLEVDAAEILENLPDPVAGGIEDYRYLTMSQGQWVDLKAELPWHHRAPSLPRSGASPVGALAALFAVLAVAAGLWGAQLMEWGHNDKKIPASPGHDASVSKIESSPAPTVTHASEGATSSLTPPTARTGIDPPLTTMRAIPVPQGGLPAPVSPSTPVRRPEIVN